MSNFSAAIFDFDGTLFDTRQAISATLVETFSSMASPAQSLEIIHATISQGLNLEETFLKLIERQIPVDELDKCVHTYRKIYNSGTGIRASLPFSGSSDALAQIHASGIPIAVVSNKGEKSVQDILTYFDMRHFVHTIVAAVDAFPTKPDPRSYFERITPALGEEACKKVLVVGDTHVDIKYARHIDATACWVPYGYGDPDKCHDLNPDIIAESPQSVASYMCS